MTEMMKLNLTDNTKGHVKDEVQHIKSMYRNEMLSIEYADEETAFRKAGMIRRKMAGTQYPVSVSSGGNVVFVTRL